MENGDDESWRGGAFKHRNIHTMVAGHLGLDLCIISYNLEHTQAGHCHGGSLQQDSSSN